MNIKSDIIFISHDATRTGAPIILLNQLKWLKINTSLSFQIILKNGGELENKFKEIAPTFIWNSETSLSIKSRILRKLKIKLPKPNKADYISSLRNSGAKVIYANSVVSTDIAIELKEILNCKVVCHIHELETAIERYFGLFSFNCVKYKIDRYIAVSLSVKNNLIENHSISESIIDFIPGFVPALEYSQIPKTKKILSSIIPEINEGSIVIGGCGTTDWRKSPDLFVQTANYLKSINSDIENVHFVWLGGEKQGTKYNQLVHDLNLSGLTNVHFLGAHSGITKFFAGFDMFLLSSREDPFPLVCLEAASMGCPIICFDRAGGMKEFVEEDCGFVIPYLDTKKASEKISQLINDTELRTKLGIQAQKKAVENHDVSVSCSKINTLLKSLLNDN